MPRIPLEDNFTDIIGKAQRGLGIPDDQLAKRAGVTPDVLAAVKSGMINEHALRNIAVQLRLSSDALVAMARREWYPAQPIFPRGFAMFNTTYGDMTVNSYLVWDSQSRQAAAFDSGANCSDMLATIGAEKLQVRHIFLTHAHEDHVADLARLQAETKAEVWAHDLEPVDFPGVKRFAENAHFHVGPVAIKTLLTSGHAPGQTTFYITGLSYPLAIVGDSLFASSMGGSQTAYLEQHRNDVQKILRLPADTVLACGHGPLTTVRDEKAHNPFFAR